MLADLLSVHYDSKHSLNLVNSLRSYISLKLDHEKKTPEFIAELRRRLYFIHEYNCQVAKLTHQYPRSRKLELLLIKYIELEFDVLYHDNPHPARHFEVACELRVLRLLQVILYPAVLNDEPLVNKNTDRLLKRAVLQLLGEVRSTYLVKNKLVCNIANKLLRKINGNPVSEKNKNLTVTSDYGSDDSDSDFENNIFSDPLFLRHNELDPRDRTSNSDCVEVLPTTNGFAPIPTIEFIDDDDIYLVYLQKHIPAKRKLQDNEKTICRKKNSVGVSNKNVGVQDVLPNVNPNPNEGRTKSVSSDNDGRNKVAEIPTDSCIIVCSDSEDEISEVTSNKKCETKSNQECKDKNNQKAVVTFEILDDDDDNENNYMVYLQREVQTNKKTKKREEKTIEPIAICLDSEDDSSVEKPREKANTTCTSSQVQEFRNRISPHKKSANNTQVDVELPPKSERDFRLEQDKDTGAEIVQPADNTHVDVDLLPKSEPDFSLEQDKNTAAGIVQPADKNSALQNNNLINVLNCDEKTNNGIESICQEIQVEPTTSTLTQVDHAFLAFNEVPTNIQDCSTNFLVDPTKILDQMTESQFKKPGEVSTKLNNVTSNEASTDTDTGDNVLGGPLMGEKSDELSDLGNASECRINESLLEEILLDDNYLLDGRKEFEELEYFLFNDSIEKSGFSLSNFSFDDNEAVVQPETFHADIQSLESYLDDSHLISVTHRQCSTPLGGPENSFGNNESTNNEQLKLDFTCRRLNPERCVKTTTCNESWKRKKRRATVKDLTTIFEQYKKVNRR